jgi:hypothetical protein
MHLLPLGHAPHPFVGPLDEVFHVGRIGVSAVMLPPRKLPINVVRLNRKGPASKPGLSPSDFAN